MTEHSWTKDNREAVSPAILRLEETLKEHKINLQLTSSTRIETLSRRLHSAMPQLADKRLSEVLLAGDAGATAKVLATVWDAARDPNLTIGRSIAQIYTTENSSVKIPKATVSKHEWGEPKRASEETYNFTTIVVQKSSGLARISTDMVEDAEWDVVERQLQELGKAYLEFQSSYILTQMTNGAGSSAAAATAGTLAFSDVAGMMATMWNGKKRRPNVLVVNPTEFADLLKDSAIQNWISRTDSEFTPGGEVPYLPGIEILVSQLQSSGTALLVDTEHAGALVIRRDITIDEYDNVVDDLVELPATARWMYDNIDTDAIGKITSA